jgi:hypothetical protein
MGAHGGHHAVTFLSNSRDDATQEQRDKVLKSAGFHLHHTYALVEVDALGQRVKLFNPWGHDHPNGDGWVGIEDVKMFFGEIDIN